MQTYKNDGVRVTLTGIIVDVENVEDLPKVDELFFAHIKGVQDFDVDPWVELNLEKTTMEEYLANVKKQVFDAAGKSAEARHQIYLKPTRWLYTVKFDKRVFKDLDGEEDETELWELMYNGNFGFPFGIRIDDYDTTSENEWTFDVDSEVEVVRFHEWFMESFGSSMKIIMEDQKEREREKEKEIEILKKNPKVMAIAKMLMEKGGVKEKDIVDAFRVLKQTDKITGK